MQRCATYELASLKAHCASMPQPEMKCDYHRIVHTYTAEGLAARAAHEAFVKNLAGALPGVAKSGEEAGLKLLTLNNFPKALGVAAHYTNTLENLIRQFRRGPGRRPPSAPDVHR